MFTGTHYWTVGQRARIAGLGGSAYFIARVDTKTQTVFVVSKINKSENVSAVLKCVRICRS